MADAGPDIGPDDLVPTGQLRAAIGAPLQALTAVFRGAPAGWVPLPYGACADALRAVGQAGEAFVAGRDPPVNVLPKLIALSAEALCQPPQKAADIGQPHWTATLLQSAFRTFDTLSLRSVLDAAHAMERGPDGDGDYPFGDGRPRTLHQHLLWGVATHFNRFHYNGRTVYRGNQADHCLCQSKVGRWKIPESPDMVEHPSDVYIRQVLRMRQPRVELALQQALGALRSPSVTDAELGTPAAQIRAELRKSRPQVVWRWVTSGDQRALLRDLEVDWEELVYLDRLLRHPRCAMTQAPVPPWAASEPKPSMAASAGDVVLREHFAALEAYHAGRTERALGDLCAAARGHLLQGPGGLDPARYRQLLTEGADPFLNGPLARLLRNKRGRDAAAEGSDASDASDAEGAGSAHRAITIDLAVDAQRVRVFGRDWTVGRFCVALPPPADPFGRLPELAAEHLQFLRAHRPGLLASDEEARDLLAGLAPAVKREPV
jgi:hypothetical protein